MTMATAFGAVSSEAAEWYAIDWQAIQRNVRRLHVRIAQATKVGRWGNVPLARGGTLVKTQSLILIDICLATICVILPPESSVLQAGSSRRLCLYTRKRLPRERRTLPRK